MISAPRTIFTFRSAAFNTAPWPVYVLETIYGEDVARWLVDQLRGKGLPTEQPEPEGSEWCFTFGESGEQHDCHIEYELGADGEPGRWIGGVERCVGLRTMVFGGADGEPQLSAIQAIHEVLAGTDFIAELRWHRPSDFLAGIESTATSRPDAA